MSTLFREPNGDLSTTRVMTGVVVIALVGTWCALSIMKGYFVDLPAPVVSLILGTLGIKAWQRGKET